MRSGFSFSSERGRACVKGAATLSLGLFALSLIACAPDVVPRKFKEPNREFGPSRNDGLIDPGEIKLSALPTAASVVWKGDIETASWYRATEDLGWLARKTTSPSLGYMAYRMRDAVARPGVSWDSAVENTAFASAAVGETRADTTQAVNKGIAMLNAQNPIIAKVLADRSAKTNWPKGRASLVTMVSSIETFLQEFIGDIQKSSVDKAVKKQLVEELKINFGPRMTRMKAQMALAYQEPKTHLFVRRVRATLSDEGLSLGEHINQRLDLAERLPQEVDRIHDAESALSVLVDFWLASSEEVRETKFKTMARALYDFFRDQSDSDLQCIKTGCGLLTRIKKFLFIRPEIDSFGVPKIKALLSEAAEDAIKAELEEEALKFLPSLHEEIAAQIRSEIDRQRDNISKISSDYGSYMRLVLERMGAAKLGLKEKETVVGLEPARIRVDLANGKIQAAKVSAEGFQTGAEAIGAGISTAVELHDYHLERELPAHGVSAIRTRQAQARLYFEQINKILLIGGFKAENSKSFDSLSVMVDAAPARRSGALPRFNLRTMITSPNTFAVPDTLAIARPAKPEQVLTSAPTKTMTIGVGGQAELILGLSRVAASLKDWQATPFDHVLGPISVAEFIPDLPRESVDQKLFPKDILFAAAIGNAGAILQNMNKDSSSVALIAPDRKMTWAHQMGNSGTPERPSEASSSRAIMATIFDIVNGERATESKIYDVARFLSAVSEFLRVTENIDQTRSEILLDAGGSQATPVAQLIQARADLKLLVMAMANFLSSETLNAEGVVQPVFSRSKEDKAIGMSGEPRLKDQAMVIRALLDASEVIKAGIYRTAALDLFSATTEVFFDGELAFFSDRPEVKEMPNLESLSSLLVAGERLAPHMSPIRAEQWRRVSSPWIGALRDAADALP